MLTRLPHRISIEKETRSSYKGGAYTSSWTSESIIWANCQQASVNADGETAILLKQQQITLWNIVTRYSEDITNKKRIVYGSHTLHIQTVIDPTSQKRMMKIVCTEENL